MFGRFPNRTAHTPVKAMYNASVWELRTGLNGSDWVGDWGRLASPTVVYNTDRLKWVVYYASRNLYFYCLDALVGVEIWKTQIGSEFGGGRWALSCHSTPAVVRNSTGQYVVVVGTGGRPQWDDGVYPSGTVTALEAFDGKVLWNVSTNNLVEAGPAVVFNPPLWKQVVYAGWARPGSVELGIPTDGGVLALDAANGNVLWNRSVSSLIRGTAYASLEGLDSGGMVVGPGCPAVSADNSTIYVTAFNDRATDIKKDVEGWVIALDAADGYPQWIVKMGARGWSSPIVVGDVVYVGYGYPERNETAWPPYRPPYGGVLALNRLNGNVIWNSSDYWLSGGPIDSSPAYYNGMVIVGSNLPGGLGAVYCLDADDGTLIWSYTTMGEVRSSPAVGGGVVYVGASDDFLYALDAATGGLVWLYRLRGDVEGSPALAQVDGKPMLYVTALERDAERGQSLYAIGAPVKPNVRAEHVEVSKESVTSGETVNITVTVSNIGPSPQSIAVKAYLNGSTGDYLIDRLIFTGVPPRTAVTVTFTLNTSYWPLGDFRTRGEACTVAGEVAIHDNTVDGPTVSIYMSPTGDVRVTSATPIPKIGTGPFEGIAPNAPAVYSGDPACKWNASIPVTVENLGTETRELDLSVYYFGGGWGAAQNTTGLPGPTTLTLPPGNATTLNILWTVGPSRVIYCKYNDTGMYYVPYVVTAEITTQIPGEDVTSDNHRSGLLVVRLPGDASGDGKATGTDLGILGRNWYWSYGQVGYDEMADFSGDGQVTGSDLRILGKWWYKQAPAAGSGASGGAASQGGQASATGQDGLFAGGEGGSPPPSGVIVCLEPRDITAAVGDTFTVNVTASNVTSLYGWQAGLEWNSTVLELLNFTEGPLLRQGGGTLSIAGTIDNEAGRIYPPYAYTLTGAETGGVNGTGVLAQATFRVTAPGDSAINLTEVDLFNTTLLSIPLTVAHGRFEGGHDVAITNITASYETSVVYPTWRGPVRINVTARNRGGFTENLTVTALQDGEVIGAQNLTLPPLAEEVLTFNWTPPSLPGYPGNRSEAWPYPVYNVSASATLVPGDVNPENNVRVYGVVEERWPGDANGDGHVDEADQAILSAAWYRAYPDQGYDCRADFNGDGTVTGSDSAILNRNWHRGPLDHDEVTVTITAGWGADTDGCDWYPSDGSDLIGEYDTYRVANRFSLADLPAGATVTKVEAIFTVMYESPGSLLDVHAYNGDGQADPQADPADIGWGRCAPSGTPYLDDGAQLQTTGTKTVDLGSQACADVMSAKAAVNRFTLSWHTEGGEEYDGALCEYTHAAYPPQLRITYYAP